MKNLLLLKVLGAIALALIVGYFVPQESTWLRVTDLVGKLFLNGLMLVVIPLVVSSMILGASRMGKEGGDNGMGLRLFGSFFLTTSLAVGLGFLMMVVFGGGASVALSHAELTQLSGDRFEQLAAIAMRLVPANVIAAASQGQILGLIFFCITFGYFSGKIPSAKIIVELWQGIFEVMMSVTNLVMRALPIGVFALLTNVFATTGLDMFLPLGTFFFIVTSSLAIFSFVVIPLIVRISPIVLFQKLGPALVTAFSTTSSAATLPVTMECTEKELGVPNRIAGITLPVGTSMSFCGSALNTCVASLFIAGAYGVPLTVELSIIILLMSVLTSFGMGGVPSAALFALVVVLQTAGIPPEGISLIIAVDRFLDMLRTPVNVLGNVACTLLTSSTREQISVPAPS